EARDDPAGDGDGLIAGLRGGRRFGSAGGSFARRAGGEAADEKPAFFFGVGRLRGGFALVTHLDPVGNGASDNFERHTPAELIEPWFAAAGLYAQIGGDLGATASLHGHGTDVVEELDAALPEGGFHEIASVDPADGAACGAHFDVVVAFAKNVDTIA